MGDVSTSAELAKAGIGAPRGTPADIVERLNRELNLVLADPMTRAKLAALGSAAGSGSAADFERLIADDTEKWTKVVKFAGIKPE